MTGPYDKHNVDLWPVNLATAIEQRLHHLAAETYRSPEELAESAMQAFFADYEDLHREVQLADEEIERGECPPQEEVVSLFAARFAKARSSSGQSGGLLSWIESLTTSKETVSLRRRGPFRTSSMK